MNKNTTKIMVCYRDPDGAVRAWASGPSNMQDEVERVAADQLARYQERKALVGDPLATAEYTMAVETLDSAPGQATKALAESLD